MDCSSENSPVAQGAIKCSGCGASILERFYLKALDKFWHEDCLKCACCDCRLGEVGSTCFTKANLILCRRDYLRLFGNMGFCSACNKAIPAFELVMRANGNVYHLECFACHECNYRFCVGDRFYLWNTHVLCEADYEDRVLATMTAGHQHHPRAHGDLLQHMHSSHGCMPHPVIVPNNNSSQHHHHLTCIVNEPVEMSRNADIVEPYLGTN